MKTILMIVLLCVANGLAHEKQATTVPAERHPARGVVRKILPDESAGHGVKLTVDEEDVPGFMEAMRMVYHVHDAADTAKLKAGDKIRFEIVLDDLDYDAENIQLLPADTPLKLAKP